MTEKSLEELLKRGEVSSALILKGDFTAEEVRFINLAYAAGVEHARARVAALEAQRKRLLNYLEACDDEHPTGEPATDTLRRILGEPQ